ncbi:MAG: DUF1365 domain-containing protein [Betaproteobacteria bacterium]|nr:DUF1365 domain-containing protein [Betaproteobacteria bacterium]MDE2122975.1 DUF1365 domain-containing protein [Betaproteobacteria bacterium]MDE2185218.1 DUF1365 domain-containing protein [Betaproteobacteria bacterium]
MSVATRLLRSVPPGTAHTSSQDPGVLQARGGAARVQPLIARGVVHHQRLRPTAHHFAYRVFFLLLPMRTLARDPALLRMARNRGGLMSFHDSDHGDGGADSLAWLLGVLREQGVADADGEIWLQTFPRVLGYVFNPVSFWYCHRTDGALRAIVAEVNNTFGERHCYLLEPPQQGGAQTLAWGQELRATKVFHVSPFCHVHGSYRFRFLRARRREGQVETERIVARIDHDDAQGPLLLTSISGVLQALTPGSSRAALLSHPFMTLGVMARIHWQALKLWRKRVPFLSKPAPPETRVTR